MALTKLPKNAIADDAVNADKIADGTIQNQDVQGSISNDKLENSSFTFNGTEVSLGASQSVVTYLDWQAVQVADGSTQVTAEAGKGYFLDTNAGVIEVFLPTSPTRGDVVGLVDYAGTFGTNQLIINTGGVNIDSTATGDVKVTTNNAIVECVYVDSAKGWMIYLNQAAGTTPSSVLTDGIYDQDAAFITATGGTITTVDTDYKVHTFTGDGCFVVSAGLGPLAVVDYLVVAGGGGGGSGSGPSVRRGAAGGGGGGYRESSGVASGCYSASPLGACVSGLPVSVATYPVTVGSGGSGGSSTRGSDGSNSVFSTITSTGGGSGAMGPFSQPAPQYIGAPGGSGGGIASTQGSPRTGGTGNTPPVSPPQGSPGGGTRTDGDYLAGGGGGGATSSGDEGQGGPSYSGGAGGCGATTSITGSPVTKSAGGQGGAWNTPNPGAGAANSGTGGRGGGGGNCYPGESGYAGGKGIVIIRYKFQ